MEQEQAEDGSTPAPMIPPSTPPNLPSATLQLPNDEGESSVNSPSPAMSVSMSAIMSPSPLTDKEREGLEERYNKLKTIAVKLKKRIHEQNEEIQNLEKEKSKYQNASKIQSEFDKAQDEVERLRGEKRVLEKDIQQAIDENVRLKVQTTEDSAKLQSLTASHKVLREKVEKLEKDEAELEQFKGRTENLEKELKEAKEAEATVEQEKRQTAILSLEITDYEKKLQDSHKQLEEKKAEVEALRADLTKRSGAIEELEMQLQNSKDTEEQLGRAKDSLQADIHRKLEKISFLQDEMNKLKEKLAEKNLEYIKLEQDYENAKLAFSSQSKELVERCESLQRIITTLEHKISVLEENKRNRESHISNLKLEIQQLESEYTNYKTKAQVMLKSQRPAAPEQQSDELENLQKIIQNFQSDISILKTDLQTLKLENENLLMEKSEISLRLNQTKGDAIEKEVRLNNELQRTRQELRQREELSKIQLDEINRSNTATMNMMESKLENMKDKYENEIRRLQEMLDNASMTNYGIEDNSGNKIDSIPSQTSAFRPIVKDNIPPPRTEFNRHSESDGDGVFDNHTQPLSIETSNMSFEQFRMIPRGECEGSESVGSAFTPRVSVDNYMSFEQLLSTSFDGGSKNGDLEKSSKESINFKAELVRSQNQVSHLTGLLRESESNCERLTQLSEALKEEIRRVEREKGRKEHLKENTEYLKNVLLKFMTLTGEDERKRLIPVMKTMLQLTNDEVLRLENCLKGQQGAYSKEGAVSGWSSYLWGGAEK